MDPTLVILAAGIGSRYGGLKQVEPVGPKGEVLLDYAIFDARRAGFGKIVFVISRALESDFRARFDGKYRDSIDIEYVTQALDAIAPGFAVPAERKKPWGTGHAVLVARKAISTPFAVINADDYYGSSSFMVLGKALAAMPLDAAEWVMVGFDLEKTLSEHGDVARGVCTVRDGRLVSIVEREKIKRSGGAIVFQAADGSSHPLDGSTQVSMNCWGFAPQAFFPRAERDFHEFLTARIGDAKAEFYLPSVINNALSQKVISVKVLNSGEQWFGMTYPQDREMVRECIRQKIDQGVYPPALFP
jgi:NDP-sugar pyrophosphorylase family protein